MEKNEALGVTHASQLCYLHVSTRQDGTFQISEVKSIVHDLEKQHEANRDLKGILCVVLAGAVVVFGILCGLMVAVSRPAVVSARLGRERQRRSFTLFLCRCTHYNRTPFALRPTRPPRRAT